MDLSKLSANEKLAVYGAAVAVIAGLVAAFTYSRYSGAWLGIIGGLAVLAIIFLPQQSPGTRLPGSKGTLLLIAGGLAGVLLALMFLVNIGFTFSDFRFGDIFWLLAVAASVVMAWAGWREFQAEGGTFQLGSSAPGGSSSTTTTTPPSEAPSAPPPSESPSVATEETPPPATESPDAAPGEDGASERSDRPT